MDDYFQHPPIPKQTKGKERMTQCAPPTKKKLRSSVTVIAKKTQPTMAKTSLTKRPQHYQGLNSANVRTPPIKKMKSKDIAHIPRNTPNGHPNKGGKITNAVGSTPSSSKSHDATISCEEFKRF